MQPEPLMIAGILLISFATVINIIKAINRRKRIPEADANFCGRTQLRKLYLLSEIALSVGFACTAWAGDETHRYSPAKYTFTPEVVTLSAKDQQKSETEAFNKSIREEVQAKLEAFNKSGDKVKVNPFPVDQDAAGLQQHLITDNGNAIKAKKTYRKREQIDITKPLFDNDDMHFLYSSKDAKPPQIQN